MQAKKLSQLRVAEPLATKISDQPGKRITVYRRDSVGAYCGPARGRTPDRDDHFKESARQDGIRNENRASTEHGFALRQDSFRCRQSNRKKLSFKHTDEIVDSDYG